MVVMMAHNDDVFMSSHVLGNLYTIMKVEGWIIDYFSAISSQFKYLK